MKNRKKILLASISVERRSALCVATVLLLTTVIYQEFPNHVPLSERIPKPGDSSQRRPIKASFPKLSATAVQAFMEEYKAGAQRDYVKRGTAQKHKRVPEGQRPSKK